MKEINKDSFDEFIQAEGTPVLVDFWSPSCKPCLALKPKIEALGEKYSEKIEVAAMNVADGNMRFAISKNVMGLPAVHIYKDGEKIYEASGEVDLDELEENINKAIG